MRLTRFAGLGVFSALLLGTQWLPVASAQTSNGENPPMRVAQQQQRGEEYLPPWQRGQQGGNDGPGEPERITPPAGGSGAANAAPPPPPGPSVNTYSSGGYYNNGGNNDNNGGGHNNSATAAYGGRRDYGDRPGYRDDRPPYDEDDTYSSNEIVDAGHRFFGSVSKGLAQVVEYTFSKQGRPNGYILGEEAGGALIAGLRYGEGTLYTKNAGSHRVYWQGPSLGYDFGGDGSKTMILVYNLYDVDQIYHRFAGVDGSAYLVGGVGVTFQTYDDIVLAPIRSGVGLRLGAKVGYLKYTRTPTWNPF
jgi:hypothetical protein